jgi:hypothetical protein
MPTSPTLFNPLNAELNSICHLLALLRAHPIFHVSKIRVNATDYPLTIQIIPFSRATIWL